MSGTRGLSVVSDVAVEMENQKTSKRVSSIDELESELARALDSSLSALDSSVSGDDVVSSSPSQKIDIDGDAFGDELDRLLRDSGLEVRVPSGSDSPPPPPTSTPSSTSTSMSPPPVGSGSPDSASSDIPPPVIPSSSGLSGSLFRYGLGLFVILGIAGGLGYYGYDRLTGSDVSSEIPVVRADDGVVKERPVDSGGEVVPNQDQTVYRQVESSGDSDDSVVSSGSDESPVRPELENRTETPVSVSSDDSGGSPSTWLKPKVVSTLTVRPDGTIIEAGGSGSANSANSGSSVSSGNSGVSLPRVVEIKEPVRSSGSTSSTASSSSDEATTADTSTTSTATSVTSATTTTDTSTVGYSVTSTPPTPTSTSTPTSTGSEPAVTLLDDSVSSGSVVGSTDETATATDTTTTTDTVTGTTAVTDTDVTATAGTTAGTDDTSVTTDTSTGTDTGTDTDTSTINISVAIPARNPLFGSSSDVSGDDSSPSDLIGTKLLALSGSDTGSSSDSATNNNDNNNDNNNNTNDTTGEGGEVVSTNIDGFGFSADTATSDTVATADTSTDASVTSPSTDYLFSVQISSRRTEEAARLSWEKISSRFVYILGGLTPDIRPTEIEGRGIFYRVRIPAETREAAINLCTQLKNAGGDCFVVR